ncbi:MAG: hypothetical protein L0Y56_10140 [Nitrospira sp.]|nr:hypothetical protein [Nitrospira sp.]
MKTIVALVLALGLSGCGLLAEVGLLDDSYKGSFIRGDAYASLCSVIGGQWSWKPGTDARCEVKY